MAGKVTVLFDDYITDKMDTYCGKDKKFRNRTSFVRFATERFVEYLERVEEKKQEIEQLFSSARGGTPADEGGI